MMKHRAEQEGGQFRILRSSEEEQPVLFPVVCSALLLTPTKGLQHRALYQKLSPKVNGGEKGVRGTFRGSFDEEPREEGASAQKHCGKIREM